MPAEVWWAICEHLALNPVLLHSALRMEQLWATLNQRVRSVHKVYPCLISLLVTDHCEAQVVGSFAPTSNALLVEGAGNMCWCGAVLDLHCPPPTHQLLQTVQW